MEPSHRVAPFNLSLWRPGYDNSSDDPKGGTIPSDASHDDGGREDEQESIQDPGSDVESGLDELSESDPEDPQGLDAEDGDNGKNVPTSQAKRRTCTKLFGSFIGGNPSSVLGLSQSWKVGEPQPTPLGFLVPKDKTGGVETYTLKGDVDFLDPTSVQKANRHVNRKRWAARRKAGASQSALRADQLLWIRSQYQKYAEANKQTRIPIPLLTRLFNEHFREEPPRNRRAFNSYVYRHLQDVRESYIDGPETRRGGRRPSES